MLKLTLFLLFLFPQVVRAEFGISFGVHGSDLESTNKYSGTSMLRSPLAGMRGGLDIGLPWVSVFGAFDMGRGSGRSQYRYKDGSTTTTVENLTTQVGLTRFSAGVRLQLIRTKYFRLFAAGGGQAGLLSLAYDKEDFKNLHGSSSGYEESEKQKIRGAFGEVGMDLLFVGEAGLRLMGQSSHMTSQKFETLNNKQLSLNTMMISLSFIQYLDEKSL